MGTDVDWREFYLKGNQVWVATDDGDLPTDDNDQVPIRYEQSTEANAYKTYPDRLTSTREESLDEWQRRLEELEDDLETRQKKLRQREEALEKWESSLKEGAISSSPASGSSDSANESANSGAVPDFIDVTQLGPNRDIQVTYEAPGSVKSADAPVDGIVEIYTDGACQGNPGPCGYGFLARKDDAYAEAYEFLGEGTNNIAELEAIRCALASLTDRQIPTRLYSDSRYAIGVLSKGWNAKANRELIVETRELLDEFGDVELRKVEGHAGHALNERADDLATQSIP
jgi:ribonuclease HI